MALAQKQCMFDPMSIKPKPVLWVVGFLKNYKQIAKNVNKFFKTLLLLKHILALPTLGQICTVSGIQSFTFDNFQSEHPVVLFCDTFMINKFFFNSYFRLPFVSQFSCLLLCSFCFWLKSFLQRP